MWGFCLCQVIAEQGPAELVEGTRRWIALPDPRGFRLRVGIESTKKKETFGPESLTSTAKRLKTTQAWPCFNVYFLCLMHFLSLPFVCSGKDSLSGYSGNKFTGELKILDGLPALI